MSSPLLKKFSSCIMRLYRDVCGCYYGNPGGKALLSDIDMLYQYDIMCPSTIIRLARIQLFGRLAAKAPPVLLSLVCDMASINRGWTNAVMDDFKWLSLSDKFHSHSSFTVLDWVEYARSNLKSLKRDAKIFAKTRFANIIPMSSEVMPHVSEGPLLHACASCSYCAPTFQQLSLHMFKKHGVKCIWKTYVGDFLHCRVCLKLFSNRECVLNHIKRRSKICRHNALLRGPVCTAEEANNLDQRDAPANAALCRAGKRRHSVVHPAVQLQGPRLPILPIDCTTSSRHHFLGRGHNYFR